MSLPGFTAEASFDKSDNQYRPGLTIESRNPGAQVLPQSVSCIRVCNSQGCYLKCSNNVPAPGPVIA